MYLLASVTNINPNKGVSIGINRFIDLLYHTVNKDISGRFNREKKKDPLYEKAYYNLNLLKNPYRVELEIYGPLDLLKKEKAEWDSDIDKIYADKNKSNFYSKLLMTGISFRCEIKS